jgi:hypothetical protein
VVLHCLGEFHDASVLSPTKPQHLTPAEALAPDYRRPSALAAAGVVARAAGALELIELGHDALVGNRRQGWWRGDVR